MVLIISLSLPLEVFAMGNQQSNSGKTTAAVLQHNSILASEKDCEVFFDALMNPPGPNQKLRDAVEHYKILMHKHI